MVAELFHESWDLEMGIDAVCDDGFIEPLQKVNFIELTAEYVDTVLLFGQLNASYFISLFGYLPDIFGKVIAFIIEVINPKVSSCSSRTNVC